jgi:hypothetical protein
MSQLRIRPAAPITLVAALLAGACSDEGPTLAPSEARISIEDGIIVQRTVLDWFASVSGVSAAIQPDEVQSLTVEFTEVAYLPEGGDEESEESWQTLTLAAPVSLDLMALPAESEGSVEIASGSVPVGAYKMVRLLTSEGEIVFNNPVNLGGGATFAADTPYPVTIPSGAQTGIKTDVSFEVTEGEDGTANAAYVVFAAGTTFQNVTAAGSGGVNLAPVIRSPQ